MQFHRVTPIFIDKDQIYRKILDCEKQLLVRRSCVFSWWWIFHFPTEDWTNINIFSCYKGI